MERKQTSPEQRESVKNIYQGLKGLSEREGARFPFWNWDAKNFIFLCSFIDEIPTRQLSTAVEVTNPDNQLEYYLISLIDSIYHGKDRITIALEEPLTHARVPAVILNQDGQISWPEESPIPTCPQNPEELIPLLERVTSQITPA